jgi:hypothetical protein
MSLTRILCRCCGNPLAYCMCWASAMTDANGETRTDCCSPEKHAQSRPKTPSDLATPDYKEGA